MIPYRLAEAEGLIYQLTSMIAWGVLVITDTFSLLDCVKGWHMPWRHGCLCNQGDDVHWDLTPPSVTNLVASKAAEALS
jgi:hypothetical protein